jgi:hypothetical protein
MARMRAVKWLGRSSLGVAAAMSAMLLIVLIAARPLAWDQLRCVYFGYGGYNAMLDAGPEGVHIGLRRTMAPWRVLGSARWHSSTRVWPADTLSSLCCGDHDWWILPGLWMGAGRQAFVDYVDVILPNWLTMPLCLLLPALWYRCRIRPRKPPFDVVIAPAT